MNGKALDNFIGLYLPTAQHMQLSVKSYDGKSLRLHAPLGPSINDKLTAFGGSIYCVAVMACWGMTYLRCVDYGLDPDIVVAEASIEYLKPIPDDIIAQSLVADERDWQRFFQHFEARGRAKINLCSEIKVNGEVAVRFKGLYAIVGVKQA
ncbi:YiiD C-terminal domain-containing protein [Zhongshania sp.]|uniref:YiiD C-terminal domain-containing protein n=1 Tax=Zhongshania sp. TaxID=1971902 RepID=UPI003561C2F2